MTDFPLARADVRNFLIAIRDIGRPADRPDFATMRESQRQSRFVTDLETGPLAVLRDISITGAAGDPLPLRLFDARAERRDAGPAMVYYHGGGYFLGDLDTHESLCAEIARQLNMPVVSVDYRLAPEHVWPAAADDSETAARWVADNAREIGLPAVTSIVLAGDSAGGNMSLITAVALRDQPAAVPVSAVWLIYPNTDMDADYPSADLFDDGYLLTKEGMKYCFQVYGADVKHWRASPVKADMAGLPPMLVQTAGLDPLRDQGRAVVAKAALAGVEAAYLEAEGNIHGFMGLRKAIPSSQADLNQALALFRPMIARGEAKWGATVPVGALEPAE